MKTLEKILSGVLILGSLLIPARAEDIALSNQDSNEVKEKVVFKSLNEAVKYENEKGEKVTIHVYDGVYPSEVFDINGNREQVILENQELVGVNPVVPYAKLENNPSSAYVVEPLKGAEIDSRIEMRDNSKLSNLIIGTYPDRDVDVRVLVFPKDFDSNPTISNVEISNNYFKPAPNEDFLAFKHIHLLAKELENVAIDNNIFSGSYGKEANFFNYNIGFEYKTDSGQATITNNLFYGSDFAIYGWDETFFFLGDEKTQGNNVFTKNKYNLRLYNPPKTIPAQWNYWFDENGKQIAEDKSTSITLEDAIMKTILISNPSSASTSSSIRMNEEIKPIEVIPCHTDSPYIIFHLTPTSADNVWTMY